MNPYTFTVSLRLHHPLLSPTDISAALDMKPTTAHAVGEPRTTPTGAALDGRYHQTYWCASLMSSEAASSVDMPLEGFLSDALDALWPKRAWLSDFAASGGTAEYFVGLFLNGNAGVTLSPQLMSRLGEIGVELGLDLYD